MKLENLKGHSIYLVESGDLLNIIASSLSKKFQMIVTEATQAVPENLLEIMNEKETELALVHSNTLFDLAPIMNAHQAGKTIVVIARRPTFSMDLEVMQALENVQVPFVIKHGQDWENQAYQLLDTLLQQKQNSSI